MLGRLAVPASCLKQRPVGKGCQYNGRRGVRVYDGPKFRQLGARRTALGDAGAVKQQIAVIPPKTPPPAQTFKVQLWIVEKRIVEEFDTRQKVVILKV